MKFIAIAALFAVAQQASAYVPIAGCLQNHTVTATDSCTSVAEQFKITEAEFYAMNPGLHHSEAHPCDNLDSGKNYCVCLKAPCPVSEAAVSAVQPAASGVSSSAPSASSNVSSILPVASPIPVTSAIPSMMSSASASASQSASASALASSQSASAKSSAGSLTAAFGIMTVGLVMAGTSMML